MTETLQLWKPAPPNPYRGISPKNLPFLTCFYFYCSRIEMTCFILVISECPCVYCGDVLTAAVRQRGTGWGGTIVMSQYRGEVLGRDSGQMPRDEAAWDVTSARIRSLLKSGGISLIMHEVEVAQGVMQASSLLKMGRTFLWMGEQADRIACGLFFFLLYNWKVPGWSLCSSGKAFRLQLMVLPAIITSVLPCLYTHVVPFHKEQHYTSGKKNDNQC